MKKPHWENFRGKRDVSEIFNSVKVRGASSLAEQAAYIRRALLARSTISDQVTANEATRIIEAIPLNPNELIGDKNLGKNDGISSMMWITYTQMALYALFFQGGEKIFKIAREFGEQLAKVNLELNANTIPVFKTPICIELPEHLRFFDPVNKDYFHCAYIVSERRHENYTPVDGDGVEIFQAISMILPCYSESGELKGEENYTTITFRSADEPIETSIARAQEYSTHPIYCEEVIRYLLKCLIYIESGDPDLREYRAPRTVARGKKLRRWAKEHENHSLVDMTLVGFSFKKPKTYLVGEVGVTGHFRWQPYGTHRDKVKLIWIEPHVRHYGNDGEPSEVSAEK